MLNIVTAAGFRNNALASATAILWGGLKFKLKRALNASAARQPESEQVAQAVRSLMRDGYAVVPGYYSEEDCAAGRAEIDALIESRPYAIQAYGNRSDLRVYGAEHASSLARRFHDDSFFLDVGKVYSRSALVNFSTLAARLTAAPDNLGSGQGWHRDAFFFQYKSMVYLSDVSPENGPFQILPGSHHSLTAAKDSYIGRLDPPPASRITAQQMNRLLTANPDRARALTAKAGTVILFDSSTIHRGMPIATGCRYALTNYFYHPQSLTPEFRRSFEPMIVG